MAAHIGLIGLAVMGQNLVLNMNDHGFNVAVFNRTTSVVDEFLNDAAKGTNVIGTHSLEELVESLQTPRIVMLMVKAGDVVDQYIDKLIPLLSEGDIIVDGGNSLFTDTNRRTALLSEKGLNFIGTGVSGGEEGARNGPSIMPGGNPAAWETVKPIFQAISAHVDDEPCCNWVGDKGAGHYVKMVHNGIEYGDMQLICEAYWLMKNLLGMQADEIGKVFAEWNKGELSSFLIEITADILQQKDPEGPGFLVDKILDTAGQKGTGQWTAANALELGSPANAIAAAVYARALSSLKEERVEASKILKGPVAAKVEGDKKEIIESIKNALYCSKICAYAQGFQLIDKAQVAYNWKLNFGEIAQIWRGGCIIRARFLQKITDAYALNSRLKNLMLDPYFTNAMNEGQAGWRKVIALAVTNGIPAQGFSAALAYYDGYRSADLPANLLQGQRDYFGAHTYERKDQPRGQFFHLDWPEAKRPQLTVD
ncbi:MAG TPA: phosphogluconate dehydrogenase (NADP(+)-dependent, decarboxylating) [Methylophilaceae bacterium]|nr:phosphogluconate dehydrogenase (NADP(+)-dependent, decarboxylating) [Methylophilaceae bacterium]